MDGHISLCDTTLAPPPACSRAVQRRRPVLTVLFDVMMASAERMRSRRMLSMLDDRMLRDIGIDRGTAQHEIDKPFWRG